MAEINLQRQILGALEDMKNEIYILKKDINYLTGYIEDTKLTEKERKELEKSISKIKTGNTSDFVSWKKAKKGIGM